MGKLNPWVFSLFFLLLEGLFGPYYVQAQMDAPLLPQSSVNSSRIIHKKTPNLEILPQGLKGNSSKSSTPQFQNLFQNRPAVEALQPSGSPGRSSLANPVPLGLGGNIQNRVTRDPVLGGQAGTSGTSVIAPKQPGGITGEVFAPPLALANPGQIGSNLGTLPNANQITTTGGANQNVGTSGSKALGDPVELGLSGVSQTTIQNRVIPGLNLGGKGQNSGTNSIAIDAPQLGEGVVLGGQGGTSTTTTGTNTGQNTSITVDGPQLVGGQVLGGQDGATTTTASGQDGSATTTGGTPTDPANTGMNEPNTVVTTGGESDNVTPKDTTIQAPLSDGITTTSTTEQDPHQYDQWRKKQEDFRKRQQAIEDAGTQLRVLQGLLQGRKNLIKENLKLSDTYVGGPNRTMNNMQAIQEAVQKIGPVIQAKKDMESVYVAQQILVALPLTDPDAVMTSLRQVEKAFQLLILDVVPLHSVSLALALLHIPDARTVPQVLRETQGFSETLAAQPNFLYAVGSADTNNRFAKIVYGPRIINLQNVGKVHTGKGVTVAIVDTGIDGQHVELNGKIKSQINFIDGNPSDGEDIHGTLLAGIIAADPDNGTGYEGIAPDAKLLAIKSCHPQSAGEVKATCTSQTLAKGLDFAINQKAQVINLSIGGPRDGLMNLLVDQAVQEGRVVVAAMGNGGPQGTPQYPAALPNVIAVTAIDSESQLYANSTRGSQADLSAPGVEILSTAPGNRYTVSNGTSLATAYVSGVIALLLERSPQLNSKQVQELLESTATDLGPPGKDPLFGSGRLNVCQAVQTLSQSSFGCGKAQETSVSMKLQNPLSEK